MKPPRTLAGTLVPCGWLLFVLANIAAAQHGLPTGTSTAQSPNGWQARVLRTAQPLQSDSRVAAREIRPAESRTRRHPAAMASTTLTFEPDTVLNEGETVFDGGQAVLDDGEILYEGEGMMAGDPDILPEGVLLETGPIDEVYMGQGPFDPYVGHGAPPCGECSGCGECGPGATACSGGWFGGSCGGPVGYGPGLWGQPWMRRFFLHAGVHGFKGPADQGRNGNFGFHEGFNLGGPFLGPYGFSYQFGLNVVHSNFSGNQVLPGSPATFGADRDQVFLTAAVFRRALCGGWQGGVAFDYFHDSYFATADLMQIRSETALVLPGQREIGYWGAYSVGTDRFEEGFNIGLEPTDQFAFFYRRRFSGGGQGRISAGFTGQGDGLIAGNALIPIGTTWSIENHFTYLIPKEGTRSGGQEEESWSVAIRLVWYPGQPSRCVLNSPYHPLFYVADNSVFLVDRE